MGVLHSLPAHLLITSPHTLHLAITQLQHGCCIHQLQSLLGNSSHHLHSLQVTSARRRPLQQDLLGWGPQFKGTFLMSPRGDIIKEFQHGPRGGPPQAAASRVTLALPECTETLCGRLRNLIGKCCGACIRSRSNASASVSLPRSTASRAMARRVTMRATSKSSGFSNNVIGRWRVSSTIRGARMH